MTSPPDPKTISKHQNNLADVVHLLHHLDDLILEYLENYRTQEFNLTEAIVVKNIRDRLINTLEAVGITRGETEDALDEQRDIFFPITESDNKNL